MKLLSKRAALFAATVLLTSASWAKDIKDWNDLVKSGVEVITLNLKPQVVRTGIIWLPGLTLKNTKAL